MLQLYCIVLKGGFEIVFYVIFYEEFIFDNNIQMTDDRWDTDDLSLKEDNNGWRQRLERLVAKTNEQSRSGSESTVLLKLHSQKHSFVCSISIIRYDSYQQQIKFRTKKYDP